MAVKAQETKQRLGLIDPAGRHDCDFHPNMIMAPDVADEARNVIDVAVIHV